MGIHGFFPWFSTEFFRAISGFLGRHSLDRMKSWMVGAALRQGSQLDGKSFWSGDQNFTITTYFTRSSLNREILMISPEKYIIFRWLNQPSISPQEMIIDIPIPIDL